MHTCDKYQNFMCWTHILLTVINILKLQRKVLIEAFNRTVAAFHDAKSVDKVKKETYTGKFCLLVYVPVNSYGHGGMVSSPNHTFS